MQSVLLYLRVYNPPNYRQTFLSVAEIEGKQELSEI